MKFKVLGGQKINGEVVISGSKNSATRILAAAMLTNEKVTLRQFPTQLNDAIDKIKFMRDIGVSIFVDSSSNKLEIDSIDLHSEKIESFDLPIRTTYLLAASMLVREGKARVPYPGGCKIGARGYDLHMMVWEKLGCRVVEKKEYIEIIGWLKGGEINFPLSTVGGTENAIMCASVADGETYISNAYVTPEVEDLIKFLQEMGAVIELEGNSYIKVKGKKGLLNGASYSIMPDRIEALTWIILGAVMGANLSIKNISFRDLEVPLIHLQHAGINIFRNGLDTALVTPDCIGKHGIQPFELACGSHPGVISDMQPLYVFLALFAKGRSIIYDYRYPERIRYAQELEKFASGHITTEIGKIVVNGKANLQAANVISPDLRGSMVLAMAAICAEGVSEVDEVQMALRGYNNLPIKLKHLGIDAKWIKLASSNLKYCYD